MFVAGQILEGRFRLRRLLAGQPLAPQIANICLGQTWLAEDGAVQPVELVVIKFQAVAGARQWDDLKLFEREALVLKQLDHPRIPRYRHAFHIKQPRAWLGLIQDYIPGQSLQTWLDQGHRFTEPEIGEIAAQVLEILVYLHELTPPVLHRNLKLSNLIWTSSRQIYMVNFGSVQSGLRRSEAADFTVVGTYGYTPMEQFGGQAVPASDLYALGACLGHLLTGVTPGEWLRPDASLEIGDRISLSPALGAWLGQMTAPALSDRFTTARSAWAALPQPGILPTPAVDLARSRLTLEADPPSARIAPDGQPLLRFG